MSDTNIVVGTTQLTGALAPSQVVPTVEIIKSTERALNGSMCVDVTAEKESLELTWNLLANEEYQQLVGVFPKLPQGGAFLQVRSFTKADGEARAYYVDTFESTPQILADGGLYWQNVKVKLVEV